MLPRQLVSESLGEILFRRMAILERRGVRAGRSGVSSRLTVPAARIHPGLLSWRVETSGRSQTATTGPSWGLRQIDLLSTTGSAAVEFVPQGEDGTRLSATRRHRHQLLNLSSELRAALSAEVVELALRRLQLQRLLGIRDERHRRSVLALEVGTLDLHRHVLVGRQVVDLVGATVLARPNLGTAHLLVPHGSDDREIVADVRAGGGLRNGDHPGD